jgi:hypothetical protein
MVSSHTAPPFRRSRDRIRSKAATQAGGKADFLEKVASWQIRSVLSTALVRKFPRFSLSLSQNLQISGADCIYLTNFRKAAEFEGERSAGARFGL